MTATAVSRSLAVDLNWLAASVVPSSSNVAAGAATAATASFRRHGKRFGVPTGYCSLFQERTAPVATSGVGSLRGRHQPPQFLEPALHRVPTEESV